MRNRIMVLLIMVVCGLMLAWSYPAGASAQESYYHPNSGDTWTCAYNGSAYWCYSAQLGGWIQTVGPQVMPANGWW